MHESVVDILLEPNKHQHSKEFLGCNRSVGQRLQTWRNKQTPQIVGLKRDSLFRPFFGWTVESTLSNWDTPNTWIVFQLKSTEDMKIWFEVVEGCFVPSFQAGKLFCEHPMCFAPCKCDLIVMWLVRFACKTASTTLRARASAWAKFIVVQNVVKQRSRIHILGCWMLGSWWYLPLENMSDAVQYQKRLAHSLAPLHFAG